MPTFCSSLRKEGISLGLSTLGLDLIPDTSPSWPAPSSCILRYGQGGALPRLPWNHLLVVTRVVYQQGNGSLITRTFSPNKSTKGAENVYIVPFTRPSSAVPGAEQMAEGSDSISLTS